VGKKRGFEQGLVGACLAENVKTTLLWVTGCSHSCDVVCAPRLLPILSIKITMEFIKSMSSIPSIFQQKITQHPTDVSTDVGEKCWDAGIGKPMFRPMFHLKYHVERTQFPISNF
jgi:hypothetical protein